MSECPAHIIIIDGEKGSGRKTLGFELALTLIYNNRKTALLAPQDSPLASIVQKRGRLPASLPPIPLISAENFTSATKQYDAIIIPEASTANDFAEFAATYITLLKHDRTSLKHFRQNQVYLTGIWELKKRIAARHKHSLNWVVCENNLSANFQETPSPELLQMSRLYGFRATPPLNYRNTYKTNISGLSSQDKNTPEFKKMLTYEDICTRREIERLAEFIFS